MKWLNDMSMKNFYRMMIILSFVGWLFTKEATATSFFILEAIFFALMVFTKEESKEWSEMEEMSIATKWEILYKRHKTEDKWKIRDKEYKGFKDAFSELMKKPKQFDKHYKTNYFFDMTRDMLVFRITAKTTEGKKLLAKTMNQLQEQHPEVKHRPY